MDTASAGVDIGATHVGMPTESPARHEPEVTALAVRLRGYFALRCRKPKPSERVRVAVKVSNSSGVGYWPVPDQAEVW
jgi:hypothetical protein